MKLVRILILEDDLSTLSKLLEKLSELEDRLTRERQIEFSVVILSEYKQVEKYINKDPQPEFDIILLDRDCVLGGSFHTLDFKKFDLNKIVGISSVPEYNEQLRKMGVSKIIHKDYQRLDEFSVETIKILDCIISNKNLS